MNYITKIGIKSASLIAVVMMGAAVHAQDGRQRPPQVVSPEVRADGKVAFRLLAPNASGPVLYLMGGPSDIAYKNARDDFSRVNHVPIVMTNLNVGHAGAYAKPHGGKYTPVALAWLDWQLKGKKEASSMFLGEDSKLKQDPEWTVETKNFAP